MPMIAMAMPIPPEKYEKWREGMSSYAGARRADVGDTDDGARLIHLHKPVHDRAE